MSGLWGFDSLRGYQLRRFAVPQEAGNALRDHSAQHRLAILLIRRSIAGLPALNRTDVGATPTESTKRQTLSYFLTAKESSRRLWGRASSVERRFYTVTGCFYGLVAQ